MNLLGVGSKSLRVTSSMVMAGSLLVLSVIIVGTGSCEVILRFNL